MKEFLMTMLIIFFICLLIFVIILYCVRFLERNSEAIKSVIEINRKYVFHEINDKRVEHEYDSLVNYESVSLKDVLTYELINYKEEIEDILKKVMENHRLYSLYNKEINGIKCFGEYSYAFPFRPTLLLDFIEKRLFKKMLLNPKTDFYIHVIKKYEEEHEECWFERHEIVQIVNRINKKENGRYPDDVWESI